MTGPAFFSSTSHPVSKIKIYLLYSENTRSIYFNKKISLCVKLLPTTPPQRIKVNTTRTRLGFRTPPHPNPQLTSSNHLSDQELNPFPPPTLLTNRHPTFTRWGWMCCAGRSHIASPPCDGLQTTTPIPHSSLSNLVHEPWPGCAGRTQAHGLCTQVPPTPRPHPKTPPSWDHGAERGVAIPYEHPARKVPKQPPPPPPPPFNPVG